MEIMQHDQRIIQAHGLEYKQVVGPGCPTIQIHHRKIGSPWWDIGYSHDDHSAETWAVIVKEGKPL